MDVNLKHDRINVFPADGSVTNVSLKEELVAFLKVRLKGQEIHHFYGRKCTAVDPDPNSPHNYTGDDGLNVCILENPTPTAVLQQPSSVQKYGYREISTDKLGPQGIYTLGLGPCIAILLIGVAKDGQAKKAALMHEDYTTPEFSVTDMFENSFKCDLENLSKIKCYLLGGNGGEAYTTNRFHIHQSEIQQLHEKCPAKIDLCFNAYERGSPQDKNAWDLTHVFFSTVNSSSYLWISQEPSCGKKNLETIQVAGAAIPDESLGAYYQENILPILLRREY